MCGFDRRPASLAARCAASPVTSLPLLNPYRRADSQASVGARLPPLGRLGAPEPHQAVPRLQRAAWGPCGMVGRAHPGVQPACGGGSAAAAPDGAVCVELAAQRRLLGHPWLFHPWRNACPDHCGACWRAAKGGCTVPAKWPGQCPACVRHWALEGRRLATPHCGTLGPCMFTWRPRMRHASPLHRIAADAVCSTPAAPPEPVAHHGLAS